MIEAFAFLFVLRCAFDTYQIINKIYHRAKEKAQERKANTAKAQRH